MKYIIYQTINLETGKIYVGVHKTENPDVFDGFIGSGIYINKSFTYMKPKTPLQFAVKKYGVKNFKRITLYVYDSEEEAYDKERCIVDLNFIKSKYTYNIAIGGVIPKIELYCPINQFNEEGKLLKSWNTLSEVSDFFNISSESFYNAVRCKEKLHGFYWSRNKKVNIHEYTNPVNNISVYQYDSEGNCFGMFNSINEASKVLDISIEKINEAIKMQSLVNNSFYLSCKLYDVFEPSPRKSLKYVKVYLYTLEGKFIQEFSKVSDLQKYLNVHSYSKIYKAIHNGGIFKQYRIFLDFKGDTLNIITNKKSKKIEVYDLIGNLLDTLDSVQEISKKYNLKVTNINRVLKGTAKTSGGYIFKYHN